MPGAFPGPTEGGAAGGAATSAAACCGGVEARFFRLAFILFLLNFLCFLESLHFLRRRFFLRFNLRLSLIVRLTFSLPLRFNLLNFNFPFKRVLILCFFLLSLSFLLSFLPERSAAARDLFFFLTLIAKVMIVTLSGEAFVGILIEYLLFNEALCAQTSLWGG